MTRLRIFIVNVTDFGDESLQFYVSDSHVLPAIAINCHSWAGT